MSRLSVLFAAVSIVTAAGVSACTSTKDMDSSASSTNTTSSSDNASTDSANTTNSTLSTSERDFQGLGFSGGNYRGSDLGRLGGGIGRLGGGGTSGLGTGMGRGF